MHLSPHMLLSPLTFCGHSFFHQPNKTSWSPSSTPREIKLPEGAIMGPGILGGVNSGKQWHHKQWPSMTGSSGRSPGAGEGQRTWRPAQSWKERGNVWLIINVFDLVYSILVNLAFPVILKATCIAEINDPVIFQPTCPAKC